MTSLQQKPVSQGIYKNFISVETPPNYNAWIIFDIICVSIVVIVLILRFVEQWKRKTPITEQAKQAGDVADFCIVLATAFIIIWTGLSTKQRLEFRTWEVGAKNAPNWTVEAHTIYFIAGFLYIMTIWLIKLAYLSMFSKVVPANVNPIIHRIIFIVTFYVLITFSLNFAIHLFWCRPVKANWTVGHPIATTLMPVKRHCSALLSVESISILSFSNVTSDLGILAIPLLMLRSYTIRGSREKYVLILSYLIGLLSLISAMFRFFTIIVGFELASNRRWGKTGPQEFREIMIYTEKAVLSQNVDNMLKNLATVEYCSAILAFCLPSLRRLYMKKRKHGGGA